MALTSDFDTYFQEGVLCPLLAVCRRHSWAFWVDRTSGIGCGFNR
jgi:hypothetical protein